MENINNKSIQKYFTKPWYFQSWFIAILFSLFIFILPLIAGITLVILDIIDTSAKKKRIAELHLDKLASLEMLESDLSRKIAHNDAISSLEKTQKSITSSIAQQTSLNARVVELNEKLLSTENELEMQEFGFFKQEFDIGTPAEYKAKMISLQEQQKSMVKNKTASQFSTNFQYNGSSSEGKKMVMREVKIALWAFNTHCDNVIAKVTYQNYALSEKKIQRALEIINENEQLQTITTEYLALKLEELNATYKYKEAVENEKQLLREQREKEREEKKLQQEIAAARAIIEKDEKHINTELIRLDTLLSKNKNDHSLIKEISLLRTKLAKLEEKKKSINLRETNATAGYVYIISNIGAFGENVLKIGVTRRLEPLERIKELGDASVPFVFDVHALVFSDKAFKLEHALHERFKSKRVNAINHRKEFFKVSIDEVQKALVDEFSGGSVNFEAIPEAREYRESLKILNNR